MGVFRFKRFAVDDSSSAMKVGTDAVLLGAAMTLLPADRHLLDAGTGSGVIALMAAQRLSGMPQDRFSITGVEIDAGAAADAAANFAASPWADCLSAVYSPLSEYSPAEPPDLIFSNPPYYDLSLRNPDSRTATARHTETLSYRELCRYAAENLSAGGRLSLILPSADETALIRTAASFGLRPFRLLRIRSTGHKTPSRLIAEFRKDDRHLADCKQEELTLLSPDGTRSAEYTALTREFYL